VSTIEFRDPPPLAEPLQVSITKAGRLLDYSTRHIRRLLISGELESVGRGRGLRITLASIRAFQQRHLNETD
jgi:hypothetical protein